jgi:hypothetical protein
VVKLPNVTNYSFLADNIPPLSAVVRLPETSIPRGQCSVVDPPLDTSVCNPNFAEAQQVSSLRETVQYFLFHCRVP